MTLNGDGPYLRYFTDFDSKFRGALRKSGCSLTDVVVKTSRSLSHFLMSFLFQSTFTCKKFAHQVKRPLDVAI